LRRRPLTDQMTKSGKIVSDKKQIMFPAKYRNENHGRK
jgi:hypothetical protein